jgi:hypothetical protein
MQQKQMKLELKRSNQAEALPRVSYRERNKGALAFFGAVFLVLGSVFVFAAPRAFCYFCRHKSRRDLVLWKKQQKNSRLLSSTFGGAGGYCLRVRLVTNLMTTGLDRLNFLSGSVKSGQNRTG